MKSLISGAVLLLTLACGSARRSNVVYDRNQLSRAELASRPSDNMHNVISSLRRNWLVTPMGAAGIGNTAATAAVVIFVDGTELGGVEVLRSMSSASVESARYYSMTEAQSKFGFRAESPVIEIVSRKPDQK